MQPQTWLAFELTALQGLTGEEAANQLNMKLTTVYKAKSNVQKLVKKDPLSGRTGTP